MKPKSLLPETAPKTTLGVAGGAAPASARSTGKGAEIRPVSRVWFELSDKIAFDKCIQLSLEWMAERARTALPREAWDGETFDVTDILGANPTKGARINATDGALWVGRLDFPDPQYPRVWVTEFFAQKQIGQLTRFGSQLTCVLRGDSAPYDVSRPNIVSRVLETLSAEADGRELSETPDKLIEHDIDSLVTLLYQPERRLPVVLVSENEDGNTRIAAKALGRQCAGAAHLIYLSNEASWELTRAIGKRMSVFQGAVRLYMPGLTDDNEDPYQHPLWLSSGGDYLSREISNRVLPFDFLRSNAASEFYRFSTIRDLAHRRTYSSAQTDVEILKLEMREIEEDRDTWRGLATSEQDRVRALDAEVERLKSEFARVEAKNSALDYQLKNRPAEIKLEPLQDRRLNSYSDLEDWADEVLGEHLYIHASALKDCRKHGHEKMLSRIESALLVIRDHIVPARMKGGKERDVAQQKLTELGMDDTPCFVDREEAKKAAGYSVSYENQTRILFDHIKYGNGYDNANQIRIYYFWDEDKKRFVIGKMPTHLRNNLTT
jgi:hypothetical protein